MGAAGTDADRRSPPIPDDESDERGAVERFACSLWQPGGMTPNQAALLSSLAGTSMDTPTSSEQAFAKAGLPHTDVDFVQELVLSLKDQGLVDGYRVGSDFGWPQLWINSEPSS
jgi:hypothetical protein